MIDLADFEDQAEAPLLVIGEQPAAPPPAPEPAQPAAPPPTMSPDIAGLSQVVGQLAATVAAQNRAPQPAQTPPAPPINVDQSVYDDPANLAAFVRATAQQIAGENLVAYDQHRLQPLVGAVGDQLGVAHGAAARAAQSTAMAAFRSSFSVSDEELGRLAQVAASRVQSDPSLASDPKAFEQAMVLAGHEAGLLTRSRNGATLPPSGRSEGSVGSTKQKLKLPPVLQDAAVKVMKGMGLKSLELTPKDIMDLEQATGMRVGGAN